MSRDIRSAILRKAAAIDPNDTGSLGKGYAGIGSLSGAVKQAQFIMVPIPSEERFSEEGQRRAADELANNKTPIVGGALQAVGRLDQKRVNLLFGKKEKKSGAVMEDHEWQTAAGYGAKGPLSLRQARQTVESGMSDNPRGFFELNNQRLSSSQAIKALQGRNAHRVGFVSPTGASQVRGYKPVKESSLHDPEYTMSPAQFQKEAMADPGASISALTNTRAGQRWAANHMEADRMRLQAEEKSAKGPALLSEAKAETQAAILAAQAVAAQTMAPPPPEAKVASAILRGQRLANTVRGDLDTYALLGIDKEASGTMSRIGNVAKGIGIAAGTIGLANMGVSAINKAYASLTEGRQKAKAYSEMLGVHKQLGREDGKRVQHAFNTLWKFNPDMASDPLTSGSFVQRAVDYGAVTTDEVAKIVQTRKQMREAQSREGLISDSIGFGTGIGAGSLIGGPA